MNADCAFIIGATHEVCQDYAVAGKISSSPYAIISDGCSSSPDTDIGARLLVKAAERLFINAGLPVAADLPQLHNAAAQRALQQTKEMNLRPQAADATLLTAHLCGDEIIVGCSGDGVVAFVTNAGAMNIYAISYASGYPYYPAYARQPERLRAIENEAKTIRRFHDSTEQQALRLAQTYSSIARTEIFTLKAANCKFAAIFSDGVQSFFTTQQTATTRHTEPLSFEQVVPQFCAFKSTGGAFVKRRFRRLTKDFAACDWRHADDLAAGVIFP